MGFRPDVHFCNRVYNSFGHDLRKAGKHEPNDIILYDLLFCIQREQAGRSSSVAAEIMIPQIFFRMSTQELPILFPESLYYEQIKG